MSPRAVSAEGSSGCGTISCGTSVPPYFEEAEQWCVGDADRHHARDRSLFFVIASMVRSIQNERTKGVSVWREFGLGLCLMVLFFATWVAGTESLPESGLLLANLPPPAEPRAARAQSGALAVLVETALARFAVDR